MNRCARIATASVLIVAQGLLTRSGRAQPSSQEIGERGRPPRIAGLDPDIVASEPPSDAELSARVDRVMVERAAIARNRGLQAAEHRVRSLVEASKSEDALPEPELMAWLWQVPIARPYAVGDASMLMIGLQQTFPAWGSLGARSEARLHEAKAEAAMALLRARDLLRSVNHAFVDWVEATSRHRVHLEHQRIVQHVVDVARAKYAVAGALTDVAQAETESARLEADLIVEGAAVDSARARLNGFLSRDPRATLGDPVQEEPVSVAMSVEELVTRAPSNRPDVRAGEERREAAAAQARASDREAKIPAFSVAAIYFAPVGPVPTNGYGVNFSMTLPWLWGARSHHAEAETERALAERSDAEDARIRAAGEVASVAAAAKGVQGRYSTLLERALPSSQRALEAAEAGYASHRGDLLGLLIAERAVIDVRMDLVMARAALDRALVDLDWTAGARLPREPLVHSEGADHAH